jgi:hypothetical protein
VEQNRFVPKHFDELKDSKGKMHEYGKARLPTKKMAQSLKLRAK